MLRAFQLPHRVPLVAPHAAPLWLCMLQGGCTALEDGIILARMLRQVWDSSDSRVIERALREFEENRTARCLPLVVRSHLIGTLQLQKCLTLLTSLIMPSMTADPWPPSRHHRECESTDCVHQCGHAAVYTTHYSMMFPCICTCSDV
jgi:hypothetical protein